MNERSIEIVREYHFDPKEVIKGLNGYYESDKRNSYITVRRNDAEAPAYLTTALYLSALIEWLREDFDIFYRPGLTLDQVEAARGAAKMCGLRAHIKDEISKRGLWCGADEDVPALVDTLFKAYDECRECLDRNRKDAVKLSEVNQELRKELNTLKDTGIYCNKLIREYCTEHGIVAPSPYFSDKACVEYLFSVIKLDRKDRAAAILYDLYHDIFHKDCNQFTYEDIATKILDKVLKTEDLLHKSVDSVNKECKATGKLMIADYEKDLLQFICKEYKDRIGLSDNTITYNPPSVRNTVLKIISDYARSRTRVDILETQIKSIFDKYKSKFTVDDYLINADPSSGLMLDCFSAWFRDTSTDSESRGKIRAEIENYKLKLKDYILKDINEHGYRYGGLEKKSIEEIVDWIITMATCPRNEWANCEIKKLRDQIDSLKGLINAMNEEVKDM